MSKYFLLAVLFLLSSEVSAQLSKNQVEELLTNGSKRDWTINKVYKKKGGTGCDGNWQKFTFYTNATVYRQRCIDGKIETSSLTWTIESVGKLENGEWQLILSEDIVNQIKAVRIDLPSVHLNEKGQQMLWRVVASSKDSFEQAMKLTSIN